MSSHHLYCLLKPSLLACFYFLFVFINVWVFITLICKSLSGIYVVPVSLLYWVFLSPFFPSPISRLDNPNDLQISLRVCLSFPGYSSSPNKLPQWIIQFQIAGRLQLKVSIWFFKNISIYPPEVPLFVLCGSISLYVIDSGHSSCCEGLAWQLQHVTVFSLEAKLM